MGSPSRRALLQTTVLVLAGSVSGCVDNRTTADAGGKSASAPTDATTSLSPADGHKSESVCDRSSIQPSGPQPRGYQPEDETYTFFEDYLTVTVSVNGTDPPPLRGFIESCDGRTEVTEPLSTGTQSVEFGPFGHHCIQEYEFWIENCRSTPTG